MIQYIEGDIFNSPAQVIVNTVNTVGVMGKGLALSYKKKYPEMFEAYREACEKHRLLIGKLMLYYAPDHWILMFPTKENWRNPSKLEYIEKGLLKFINTYAEKGITSIAFPKLGCGNGELSWDAVRPLMEKYLKQLPIKIYIYLGLDTPSVAEHREPQKTAEWLRQHAKDMSFDGLCDDIQHGQSMLPYQMICQKKRYSVTWNNGLECVDENRETVLVSRDKMFDIWDAMRTRGAFAADQSNQEQLLFFELLLQLGYLSTIRIQDGAEQPMRDGYQVNEGCGRVYALRGEAE